MKYKTTVLPRKQFAHALEKRGYTTFKLFMLPHMLKEIVVFDKSSYYVDERGRVWDKFLFIPNSFKEVSE